MKIIFAGTPDFAAKHLAGLLAHGVKISTVITQPDKPGKRGKKLVPSPVKTLAEAHDLPVLQPQKFRDEDIAGIAPDLMIVVAYGQILRQSLLDVPTHGCINVHASILPRWRGAAPIQRAIEHGDQETGVCIMQMDAGLDTGPVLYSATTPIEPSDTSADLSERLIGLGLTGLMTVIEDIEQGRLAPQPQTDEGATYASKILKSEAKIDWQLPATAIRNKIHAFNPDPICFSEINHGGQTLRTKLHKVSSVSPIHQGKPGEVLAVTAAGVEVATGDGSVTIELLQLPLGKGSILNGRDILNARSDILHAGARFT